MVEPVIASNKDDDEFSNLSTSESWCAILDAIDVCTS
jgi:hypothetical protein